MTFMYEWIVGALLIEAVLNTLILVVWLMSVATDGFEKIKLRTVVFGELAALVFSLALSLFATLFS